MGFSWLATLLRQSLGTKTQKPVVSWSAPYRTWTLASGWRCCVNSCFCPFWHLFTFKSCCCATPSVRVILFIHGVVRIGHYVMSWWDKWMINGKKVRVKIHNHPTSYQPRLSWASKHLHPATLITVSWPEISSDFLIKPFPFLFHYTCWITGLMWCSAALEIPSQ